MKNAMNTESPVESLRGSLKRFEDGTILFTPSQSNSCVRYEILDTTRHGQLKATKKHLIFELRFPKTFTQDDITIDIIAETALLLRSL